MGAVMEKLGARKGECFIEMTLIGNLRQAQLPHSVSAGLFGYRNEFLTDTKRARHHGLRLLKNTSRGHGDIGAPQHGLLIAFLIRRGSCRLRHLNA